MPYKDKNKEKQWKHDDHIAHREYFKNRQRQRRAEYKKIVQEAKSKPCADCKIQYPYYVMEFDHLRDKVENLARMSNFSSKKKLVEEIAKCDVVCSNCHRERSFVRLQNAVMAELPDALDLNPSG